MMRTLAFAALLTAAAAAPAQTLYKSTMPDGKIVYSEKPVIGAKRVDAIEPPPAKTGTTTVTPEEKARLAAKPDPAAALPQSRLDEARTQLKQAEAAREAGKEPLPGERIGTAGGGSRLTDVYHARQKNLDVALDAARQRLKQLEGSK